MVDVVYGVSSIVQDGRASGYKLNSVLPEPHDLALDFLTWTLTLKFGVSEKAFVTRFKNQETADEDIENNSQGTNETVDNYVFRFQQATSDSELPEKYLVQKPIKGLHPVLGSALEELREFDC